MNLNGIRLDETNKEINQLMIYDSIFIRILKKKKKTQHVYGTKKQINGWAREGLLECRRVAWE